MRKKYAIQFEDALGAPIYYSGEKGLVWTAGADKAKLFDSSGAAFEYLGKHLSFGQAQATPEAYSVVKVNDPSPKFKSDMQSIADRLASLSDVVRENTDPDDLQPIIEKLDDIMYSIELMWARG